MTNKLLVSLEVATIQKIIEAFENPVEEIIKDLSEFLIKKIDESIKNIE